MVKIPTKKYIAANLEVELPSAAIFLSDGINSIADDERG